MLFKSFGERRSLENPRKSLSDASQWEGWVRQSATGINVTEAAFLSVPAVWQALNVISGTLAHLPMHLYRRTDDEAVKVSSKNPLYRLVHDRANDVQTSFAWRKWVGTRLGIDGRAISIIAYDAASRPRGFIPVEWSRVKVEQGVDDGNRLVRKYIVDSRTEYDATDVLDFMLFPKANGYDHYTPFEVFRNPVGLVLAAEQYASTMFAAGGVPPLALTGPALSPDAATRAAKDINGKIKAANKFRENVLNVPAGHDIKVLGFDPSKQQLLELRQFQISEVARIFNVAPSLLHDLTTGTYSNVEQQNLSFAQHTMVPLCEMIEQEMNAKLFAKTNTNNFVEFNLDGLQRGDFATRMAGMAQAVQTALRTPNEARALDNLPPMEGGDRLLIQGATVPLSDAGKTPTVEPTVPQAPDDQASEPEA